MSNADLWTALLFVPGDDRHKIEKAAALNADAIILDLEDGVALNRKAEARVCIHAALSELSFGRSARIVRINSLDSPFWRDDLASLLQPPLPDAIMLPKATSAAQIAELSGTAPPLPLIPIIESGRGLIHIAEIAAQPGLSALAFGAEDYTADIGAARTAGGDEVLMARSMVVLHAKVNGLAAFDTPYIDLHDLDGLRTDARKAQTLGFTGKLAIHPRQLPVLHEVFMPTTEETDRARRLIVAYETGQAQGSGVLAFEGRMVDAPMVRAALTILARARGAEPTQRF
jgi:citrate lyase beta subunit